MQLWIGAHQTWCGVRVLPLLLWSWGVSPLRILSGGCSFVIMLVKALVTASAFASGMKNTWGLLLACFSPYHLSYLLRVSEFCLSFWVIECVLCHPLHAYLPRLGEPFLLGLPHIATTIAFGGRSF
jgi:hypothetical protein